MLDAPFRPQHLVVIALICAYLGGVYLLVRVIRLAWSLAVRNNKK
jgi:hypothetical protein